MNPPAPAEQKSSSSQEEPTFAGQRVQIRVAESKGLVRDKLASFVKPLDPKEAARLAEIERAKAMLGYRFDRSEGPILHFFHRFQEDRSWQEYAFVAMLANYAGWEKNPAYKNDPTNVGIKDLLLAPYAKHPATDRVELGLAALAKCLQTGKKDGIRFETNVSHPRIHLQLPAGDTFVLCLWEARDFESVVRSHTTLESAADCLSNRNVRLWLDEFREFLFQR